ncbi:hypothetical protein N2152v2_001084 [Parachlorella kessleri]
MTASGPARLQVAGGQPGLQPTRPSVPDVNLRDDNNCTPLHLALLNGHLEVVRLLLEAGASPHKGCEGSPPLHIAVCTGGQPGQEAFADEAARLLLARGAMPYDRDDHGRTPLHWAAVLGLTSLIGTLVQAAERLKQEAAATAAAAAAAAAAAVAQGAPATAVASQQRQGEEEGLPPLWIMQDKQGNTALHLAARHRQPDAVEALCHATTASAFSEGAAIAAGATNGGDAGNVNSLKALMKVRNKAGQTALHAAALAGCSASAAALLVRAAPGYASGKDKQGMTPAQMAARRGHAALAAQLAGALPAGPATAVQHASQHHSTLLVAPPQCLRHLTCPEPVVRGGQDPPPENVNRLRVLTTPGSGALRATEFEGSLRWDEAPKAAALSDVLRIHDWAYVRRIQALCDQIPDSPASVGHLDGDTAVSHHTFAAALAAAGAVCSAVDALVRREVRNAFCAVRPPGHHAGPSGIVTSAKDPLGSHGFCLFNNVAIGAAYAMSVYRHAGIKRVAILDFDVHHGNGTEACVAATIPSVRSFKVQTPYSEGMQAFPVYRPWLGAEDRDNIFFASVQGYGPKVEGMDVFVYPGSGATCDTRPPLTAAEAAAISAAGDAIGAEPPPQAPTVAGVEAAPAPPMAAGMTPAVPAASVGRMEVGPPSAPLAQAAAQAAAAEPVPPLPAAVPDAPPAQPAAAASVAVAAPPPVPSAAPASLTAAPAAAGPAAPAAAAAATPLPMDGVEAATGAAAVAMDVDPSSQPVHATVAGPPSAAAAATALPTPAAGAAGLGPGNGVEPGAVPTTEEDPDHEFVFKGGEVPPPEGPRIIDVGIPGPGPKVQLWRRAWRDKILPALVNFRPDIIFVSAGFDAHKKDEINFRYVGVTERDYEWLTDQLVQVANRCCEGRLVSALEGGYRIQGGLVSAFARSVAAHVRALAEPHSQAWDPDDAKWEREHEKRQRAEVEARRAAAATAERAARAAAAVESVVLVPPPRDQTAAAAAAAVPGPGQQQGLPEAPGAGIKGEGGPQADVAGALAPAAVALQNSSWPGTDVPGGGMPAVPAAAAVGIAQQGAGAEPDAKRRRRGTAVDYVALNRKLEAEQAAKGAF